MSNLMQHGIQKIYPQLEREIKHLMEVNKDCIPTISIEDIPIVTPFNSESAYCQQIYVPQQNTIYFIPRSQHSITKWHYFNVTENKMYEYTSNISYDSFPYDYYGGIYDYKYNRIIILPCVDIQGSIQIDISSMPPRVKKNSTNRLQSTAVFKGFADIFNDKIFLCPYGGSNTYHINYIDSSNPQTIEYNSVSISNSTQIFNSSYLSNSTIIRENNCVYYLLPQFPYLVYHDINNTAVYQTQIYGNNEHSTNGFGMYGSNQVYIPHLSRSYYGTGVQYLDYNLSQIMPITSTSTTSNISYVMNGLNGKLYYLSQSGDLNVTDILTNSTSNLNTNITLGANTTQTTATMTLDGNIIIFPISASKVSTSIKKITINLNLKVKPSVDLLLSGLINN